MDDSDIIDNAFVGVEVVGQPDQKILDTPFLLLSVVLLDDSPRGAFNCLGSHPSLNNSTKGQRAVG